MPHKDYAPGNDVLAADFNQFIADQIVAQYASAAARASDWTSPPAGAVSWLNDMQRLEVFRGGAWAGIAPAQRRRVVISTGDIALANTTNWQNFGPAWVLSVPCMTGDEIQVEADGMGVNLAGTNLLFDISISASGNWFGTASGAGSGQGLVGWQTGGYAGSHPMNKIATRVMVAADISASVVQLNFNARLSAAQAGCSVAANPTNPFTFTARNLGPPA
jgi:hypothetical protein